MSGDAAATAGETVFPLVTLTVPVGSALIQAGADLAAAEAGTAQEWRLPDGDHVLTEAITLDLTGRTLRLRGSDTCVLRFAAGGLSIAADAVEVVALSVVATAVADGDASLKVAAARIAVADVDVAAAGAGAVVAVDLEAGPGSIDVEDLQITRAEGTGAIGLRALGNNVRVTAASFQGIASGAGDAVGARLGATADLEAVELTVDGVRADPTGASTGLLIAARGRMELARLQARNLTGANVVGIAAFGFGAGAADASVSAVDLDVEHLLAVARATGIFMAAPRKLSLRGFTVADVVGASTLGALVTGGLSGGIAGSGGADGTRDADVEVGFGSVDRVVAGGGDAAGVRVIAAPSPRPVIVRDLSVSQIAGAPVPTSAVPPRDGDGEPAWQTWAGALLADLSDSGQPRDTVPAVLSGSDVVGLAVTAVVDDVQPFLDEIGAGDVVVIDSLVRTVAGSALQAEGGLRPLWVRRSEFSTTLRAGYLQADQLIIANTTWDRLGAPLLIGPGEVRAFDSIFSRVTSASGPVTLDADADWIAGVEPSGLFADGADDRFDALGALPYVEPGAAAVPASLAAGALPPPEAVDLRLSDGSPLHARAVATPDDDVDVSADDRLDAHVLFVGAYPPETPAPCNLYDPLPPTVGGAASDLTPSPVVNYRARDARSLLGVMLDRAQHAMRPWVDRGPADFTTMMLEAVAERLDHLAYQQERATAEGFLDDARLRRSVEDHVRPLDYRADEGLSATVMLRFALDLAGVAGVIAEREQEAATTADAARAAFLTSTLAGLTALADDGALEIPAGTLAANRRSDDSVIAFATEQPLAYFPHLDAVALVRDLPAGATSAALLGALPGLAVGRWMVLWRGHGRGGHVVRVTTLARGTDVTDIGWDPRRPLPWALLTTADPSTGAPAAVVLGNVVPAHHGVPLSAITDDFANADLRRYGASLSMDVNGGPGVEVALPFSPVSLWAPGYPLPGEEGTRRGLPQVGVLVEDDPWTRVDDLALVGASDEVFAVRTAADGRPTLRFGDGVSGAALPARANKLRLDLTIGAGRVGNVAERILTRLLNVPVDATHGPVTGWLFREDMEVLRGLLSVDNPIAAVGGRDPESIDRMRYRAPLLAARPLSAVTPADYAEVARALPEVVGAHARVRAAAVRPVVSVTVLLRHEDTLDPDERLRRWAAVRAAVERARLLGFDVESVPPVWAPLDLDVVVDAHPHADAGNVREGVVAAISGKGGMLDPDTTGLGGDVQLADLYRAVMSADGVAAARVRRFRRLRRNAPERLHAGFIRIRPSEVAVVRGPARPSADGVLTVTICGGLR